MVPDRAVDDGVDDATFCFPADCGSRELRIDDLPAEGWPTRAMTKSSSPDFAADHIAIADNSGSRPNEVWGGMLGFEDVEVGEETDGMDDLNKYVSGRWESQD